MSLKYSIIVTCAIGGYYGAMLAYGGTDVHFIFHSDYDYVKGNGFQVDSVNANFHLDKVNAYKSTKSRL